MSVIVLHAFENMLFIKDRGVIYTILNARLLHELLFNINQSKGS